jgi:hypothetical protein
MSTFMTSAIQGNQGPDADKLGQEIEKAIADALEAANVGRDAASQARDQARQALEEARASVRQGGGFVYTGQIPPSEMIPPQAVDISIAFFAMLAFIIVGLPLARAFARRMDRRGEAAPAAEVTPRLDRIEQAVDAIAIEIERISENQRYASRVMNELRGLPQPAAAAGWQAEPRVAEPVPREGGQQRP